MQQVFTLTNPEMPIDKIILVDDIVTSGPTLEACGVDLLKIEGLQLSIATIVHAE
jgi:predicted amidophosphoribosyltransferase